MKVFNYLDCEGKVKNQGVIQRSLVTAIDGAMSFRAFVWDLEPGIERSPETHSGEHIGLVISGKGLFRSGNKEVLIEKNSVVFIGSNEPHSFVNNGKQPLRYLLVHTNYGEAK